MKRWKGVPFALQWIADNDEPEDMDEESVSGYISTMLIADCTGRTARDLARSIVNIRRNSTDNQADVPPKRIACQNS